MKVLVPLLLAAAALSAQSAAPGRGAAPAAPAPAGKSAFDKATLEAYVRHLQLYVPNVQVTVGDPVPSPLPGFQQVTVRASLGAASEERLFHVSKDGRKIVTGSVYDIAGNPFQPELEKLTTAGFPSIGTPGAPVVIVLFSDFQCQYCREEAKMLREHLVKAYPTEVRLYFKDYPLEQIHPWAKTASVGGRCVFKQNADAFWEYHDWVFENQAALTAENVKTRIHEFAKSKNWNMEQLEACMVSPEAGAEVDRSAAEARSLGVSSTPTMFINGRKVPYAIKWENLKQVVDFEIGYQRTAHNAGEACCSIQLSSPLDPPKKK
jgi:protein-disulfide isomerase